MRSRSWIYGCIAALLLTPIACSVEGGAGPEAGTGDEHDNQLVGAVGSTGDFATDKYDGHYGQPITIGLFNLGTAWTVGKDGALVYSDGQEAPTNFIIEFVRTTPTKNTNAEYSNRKPGTVYLRDVFRLKVQHTDKYVRFDPGSRTFRVDGGGPAAEFLMVNKYGGKIDTVDTDRYCKGVYDSFEYYESVNNRNVKCSFPYLDCYGRCAMRKLYLVQGSSYFMVGQNWRDTHQRVTIDGVSGWQYYEHVLP